MNSIIIKIVTVLFFSYPLLLISDIYEAFITAPPLIWGYIIYIRRRFIFMIVAPRHFMSAYEEYSSSLFADENSEQVEMVVYHKSAEEFTEHVSAEFEIDFEDEPLD